jgi:hypothetical protein
MFLGVIFSVCSTFATSKSRFDAEAELWFLSYEPHVQMFAGRKLCKATAVRCW